MELHVFIHPLIHLTGAEWGRAPAPSLVSIGSDSPCWARWKSGARKTYAWRPRPHSLSYQPLPPGVHISWNSEQRGGLNPGTLTIDMGIPTARPVLIINWLIIGKILKACGDGLEETGKRLDNCTWVQKSGYLGDNLLLPVEHLYKQRSVGTKGFFKTKGLCSYFIMFSMVQLHRLRDVPSYPLHFPCWFLLCNPLA